MTETTIILMVFLLLVFGMMDLGIMVARSQSLAEAARNGARASIVHGEFLYHPLARRGSAAWPPIATRLPMHCGHIWY